MKNKIFSIFNVNDFYILYYNFYMIIYLILINLFIFLFKKKNEKSFKIIKK